MASKWKEDPLRLIKRNRKKVAAEAAAAAEALVAAAEEETAGKKPLKILKEKNGNTTRQVICRVVFFNSFKFLSLPEYYLPYISIISCFVLPGSLYFFPTFMKASRALSR